MLRRRFRKLAADLTGLPEADVYPLVKYGRERYGHGVMALHEQYNIQPEDFLERIYTEIDHSPITVYDGLAEILSLLARRIPLYLLTNSNRSFTHRVLAHLKITSHFSLVQSIEDSSFHLKPDPQAYKILEKRTALDPPSTLVVDDSYRNLETATKLGFPTALVSNQVSSPPTFWEMHEQRHHEAPNWVSCASHSVVDLLSQVYTLLQESD